jgi:cytochrome c peroxidase
MKVEHFVFLLALAAWGQNPSSSPSGPPSGFSAADWTIVRTLSPLPAQLPVDITNKYRDSPEAAMLGQKLFFEPRLSGAIQRGTREEGQLGAIGEKGKIACRNCHMPESKWLFDTRSNNGTAIPNATALGSKWMTRKASSIVNTVFYVNKSGAHWRENDGYSDSEWFDAQSEPEGAQVQNGSRLQLAHVIYDYYRDDYKAAFPDWPLPEALADLKRFPPTGSPSTDVENWKNLSAADKEIVNRVLANYGKAIEAYLRKLVSRDAPFDRYVAGDSKAISDAATAGIKLFIGKAGCVTCHSGPMLSDDDFHVIGLKIDTARSPHADPSETGRAANLTTICDPVVAGGDFSVNGPFSDDPGTTRNGTFCKKTIAVGLWRTKGLRQVAETPPYFHDGQAATLDEVIEFYDRGGDGEGEYLGNPKEIKALHLSRDEKAQLKEFLKTLTGTPVPVELLRDLHRP